MTADLQITPSKSRDLRFDLLKVLGLLCIVLAHSKPPTVIFQARNFDVPLMVIVSGALFYLSSQGKSYNFFSYLRKRLPRLMAPVWLFLVFFFPVTYGLYLLAGQKYPYDAGVIMGSFLLRGGIGYVYIIRIFVLMALVSPLILGLYRRIADNTRFLLAIAGIYVSYEIFNVLIGNVRFPHPSLAILVKQYLIPSIPYGCLVGLGIVLIQLNRRVASGIAIAALAIFTGMFGHFFRTTGKFVQTQDFKYPPTLYYLSYSIGLSILAYLLVDWLWRKYGDGWSKRYPAAVAQIVFVSASSLWVYLWHIFWLICWRLFPQQQWAIAKNFVVTFLVITVLSIATTYLQKRLVSSLIKRTAMGPIASEWMTVLFLR